jgi:PAS domain S-box-containing protein
MDGIGEENRPPARPEAQGRTVNAMKQKALSPGAGEGVETEEPRQTISAMQKSIVDHAMITFLGFAALTSVAYLVLARHDEKWIELTALLASLLFLSAGALLRRQLSITLRALLIIGVWFALGAAGILFWGVAGSGMLFLVSAGGLTALFFGPWAGALAVAASLLITAAVGAAVHSGLLSASAEIVHLTASPTPWLFHSISFGLFAALVVFILGRQHTWMKELILKLGGRSRELERLNGLLESEIEVRRRTEAALRAGEERLAKTIECARESFFVIAPDGRFTEVNSHACESTGYSREELLSMSVWDVDLDLEPGKTESLLGSLAGGGAKTVERAYRRKDGSTYPVEISIGLMGEGEEASAIVLARNVSERKAAEEAAAYRYRCEKMVTGISARFIHLPSEAVSRNIEVALEQICSITQVDAAYLLLMDEETRQLAPAHLWQNERHVLTREVVGALARRSMFWQKGRFGQSAVNSITSIQELPREAGIDPEVLAERGIRSFLEVPMIYRGEGVGILGMVSTRQERRWSEKEIGPLRMISQVLTEALERKRGESALRISEATLRSILRAVPVGIGTAEKGRILGGNQQLFSMIGYTEEELTGESFATLYPDPGDFDRVCSTIYPQLAETGRADIETRWRCKDGRVLDILLNTAVVEPGGSSDQITFTALDITERKIAEKALRESERNYREIFNATQEAIFIHDAHTGRILAVNRSMTDMFGYSEEEAGRLPLERISSRKGPYTEPRALENIRKAVELGPQVFEWQFRKKNGEAFWSEVTLKNTEIGGKGRVLAVVRDIDHRKRAERALRESEERFRNLVENAPAGICILRNDRIAYLNPEQKKILGPLDEDWDIYRLNLHPDDNAKFMQHYRAIQEGRQPKSSLEMRLFPPDNRRQPEHMRWVHCDISVIPYEGDPAMLMTMVDMTRTKELERLVYYREKMVSLGHVAAGIAHEIRNPLSGINVLLDGIRENFQDPASSDDIYRLLNETQKASDKIAGVIKRVLDFSKPSQPQLLLTDINLPIKEALELSKTTLRKSGIDLEIDLNDDIPPLYIDEQMIEQVIMNLIGNAIEALKDDRPEKRLRVVSRKVNGYVVIDIADSGPGVPEALRDKIFDPFYTTRSDGSGIGLSLCQRLVADHGGNISISNSEWGGAEFSIRIPTEKRMTIR